MIRRVKTNNINEYYATLGKKLEKARVVAGLSQDAVGIALSLPRSAISKLESGARTVSALEITVLAKLYKHPVSHFFEENNAESFEDFMIWIRKEAA